MLSLILLELHPGSLQHLGQLAAAVQVHGVVATPRAPVSHTRNTLTRSLTFVSSSKRDPLIRRDIDVAVYTVGRTFVYEMFETDERVKAAQFHCGIGGVETHVVVRFDR